jgi:hypothetical protein
MDEYDDELDEMDELDGFERDNDLFDDLDESDDFDSDDDELDKEVDEMSDGEVEMAGLQDGEFDANNGAPAYSQYGSSVDLNELDDDQKDIYDTAYHAGFDSFKKC